MSIERQFHVFAKAVEDMRKSQWAAEYKPCDGNKRTRLNDEARVDRLLRKLLHPMDSD